MSQHEAHPQDEDEYHNPGDAYAVSDAEARRLHDAQVRHQRERLAASAAEALRRARLW